MPLFGRKVDKVTESKDPKEIRNARAAAWWKKQRQSSKKCDACSTQLTKPNGYLLDTSEVIASSRYMSHAASIRSRSRLSSMNVPGMDSIVMDAVMPASNLLAELELTTELKKVKTPWLICAPCLDKYWAS